MKTFVVKVDPENRSDDIVEAECFGVTVEGGLVFFANGDDIVAAYAPGAWKCCLERRSTQR